jgi:hypothetical protein
MTITDLGVVLSFLAIVVVVAKMLRAFRLLEARVTLLQQEIECNHGAFHKAAAQGSARPPTRTPVLGVPVVSPNPPTRTPVVPVVSSSPSPRPASADARPDEDARPRNEAAEQSDDEIAWAWLVGEQERLRKAMGRDFQARKNPRPASEIRGVEMREKTAPRVLSAREVAAKLERK